LFWARAKALRKIIYSAVSFSSKKEEEEEEEVKVHK
jgi:hypothetical protein